MSEKLSACRITVTGRVQGVGFRYSTLRKASGLGLTGWVRNERDGSVEIYCEGPAGQVAALLDWLEAGGPASSRISHIEHRRAEPTGTFRRFSVDF
jgi:acylphosphatase